MAEYQHKKYYWLKLKEDFFDTDTIEWIEEQKNGKEYCLFYLKMCLKSLRTNGILIRNVGQMLIPYDVDKLAEMTKTPPDTVRVAMELFKNLGLIQVLDNGALYMSQLTEMVGSQTEGAAKKALQRAKKQEALPEPPGDFEELPEPGTESGQKGDICPPERRDKEIKREERRDEEKENKRIDYQLIADLYNEICISFPRLRTLSDKRKKAIKARINSGYTEEDFRALFTEAEKSSFLKGKNKRNWSATFDWLITDGNMAKVLEGNYTDKTNKGSGGNPAGEINYGSPLDFYK